MQAARRVWRLVSIVTLAGIGAGLAACKTDDGEATGEPTANAAPSCDDLQVEANACDGSQASKEAFARFGETCKAQSRFNDACRTCLKGKICTTDGTLEQCDPACGK